MPEVQRMTPRDPSQPIDFKNEAFDLADFGDVDIHKVIRWGKSIAARVEESTIQRCEAEWEILKTDKEIPRLYGKVEKPK